MTGFDPTAPARNTEKDEPAEFADNVVPPEALTENEAPPSTPDVAERSESGDDALGSSE